MSDLFRHLTVGTANRNFGVRIEGLWAKEERDRILKAVAAKRRILLIALNGKLEDLARSRPEGFVTADDAHRIVEGWPEASGLDPRWLGAVWRSGAWIKDGYVPSLRRKCHARPVAKWRLDPT